MLIKFRLLTSVGLIVIANLLATNNSANAQQAKFMCATWRDVPTTVAQTASGIVPIIRWTSSYFKSYDPQSRCEIVSQKFQQSYQAGTLKYITTGRKNGQNIICVAHYDKGPCEEQLFTLTPDSPPGLTLQRLMDINTRDSHKPINQSRERIYVNMEEFLEQVENSDRSI